jgi:hypothetical protein
MPASGSRHVVAARSARVVRSRCVGRVELAELLGHLVGGVEHLAQDVELLLVPRRVADAHGAAVAEAGQVRELGLGQAPLALDAVHDLHALVVQLPGRVGDPAKQATGLVRARRDPQRADREAQVAQPCEAIVEVESAPIFSGSEVVAAATTAPVG